MFIDLTTALAPLAAQHPYLCFIGTVLVCLSQIIVAVTKAITAWLKQPKPPVSGKLTIPHDLG
jgi:hypothetical protein